MGDLVDVVLLSLVTVDFLVATVPELVWVLLLTMPEFVLVRFWLEFAEVIVFLLPLLVVPEDDMFLASPEPVRVRE
ncbi:unnamed protein product [marine sediment metagenome]|uniref:Uncharacterized protein n=1 Tax=marine sediment metagenome TaxID=412755 RepID=X0TV64_9ZZZZ